MEVIELCGDRLVESDLPTLLAHYPWLKDFRPETTEKAIKILKSTSAHLLSTEPFSKSELPLQTNSSGKYTPRQAVEWLTGTSLDEEKISQAFIQEDGDEVKALLRAAGQTPSQEAVNAVCAFLEGAEAPPLDPLPITMPTLAGDTTAIDLFKNAWEANRVKKKHNGIHIFDNGEWIFRVNGYMCQGSLGAAYWIAAKDLHLEPYVLETYVLTVGNDLGCLEQEPPNKYLSMIEHSVKTTNLPRVLLLKALQDGILHKLCILDYIMFNNTRTSGTVYLADNGAIKLSTAKDQNIKGILPAYIRVWFSKDWANMFIEEKIANWPSSGHNSIELNRWLQSLDLTLLQTFGANTGLDLSKCLDRLNKLKQLSCKIGFDLAVCQSWIYYTN